MFTWSYLEGSYIIDFHRFGRGWNYQPENVWWQLRGWNQGSLVCQVMMTMILVAVTAGWSLDFQLDTTGRPPEECVDFSCAGRPLGMIRMDRFVPESFRGKISMSTFLPHGKAGNRLPSVCRGEGIQDSIRQWRAMESRHKWAPATAVVWAVWRTLREVGLVWMGSPLWNLSWKIVRNLEFPLYMV